MNPRRIFAAFVLALALLAGQQAAALHELTHAAEHFDRKPGTPAKHSCDQCFLGAQLAGAVGAHVSIPPVVVAGAVRAAPLRAAFALPAPLLSFRSRAPPTLL